ncbi:MAG: type III-B CRISPR module RAMP protein Cmr4 [Planctomycetota bacterium]|nr:type III-B CRISPR module RAMP protein Cmr4 [Planctomycetota bacterium]
MSKSKGIITIHSLTTMHPGSGSALGAVDLPVQRERHTRWPVIPSSSLKGVMRSEFAKMHGKDNDLTLAVFGPDTDNAADHAGALTLTDGRLLLFPVRSMKGVFALTTCPAVLNRLKRDLELAGISKYSEQIDALSDADSKKAFAVNGSPLLANSKALLEDVEVKGVETHKDLGFLKDLCGLDDYLAQRLIVVSDDDFSHFSQFCTEVVNRIRIESETKTVAEGALFNEEVLPPECFFYTGFSLSKSRKSGFSKIASELAGELKKFNGEHVQIGADETIGRGFCKLTFTNGGE